MLRIFQIISSLIFIFGIGACAVIPKDSDAINPNSVSPPPGKETKSKRLMIASLNTSGLFSENFIKDEEPIDNDKLSQKINDLPPPSETPLVNQRDRNHSLNLTSSHDKIKVAPVNKPKDKLKIKPSSDIFIKIRKPSNNSNLSTKKISHTNAEAGNIEKKKEITKKGSVKKLAKKKNKKKKPAIAYEKAKDGKLWLRVRKNLELYTVEHPRIDEQLEALKKKPTYIKNLTSRSRPYMYMVVNAVEAKKLPMEVALLPMIESAFNPDATSSMEAAGLWQIMPETGTDLGVMMDDWYDGRRDIGQSTKAALKYLQRLHKYFEGDWLLALAAYNAGEGRVKRAQEANQKAGKETDFWSLELPKETMNYVPKLLAISRIVATPSVYKMKLTKVADSPYLYRINLTEPVVISEAATTIDVNEEDIRQFNPAFTQDTTHPEKPSSLFLPKKQAQAMIDKFEFAKSNQLFRVSKVYVVKRGDTLSSIAKRHEVNYKQLAAWNNLGIKSVIRPGQKLKIARQPEKKETQSSGEA